MDALSCQRRAQQTQREAKRLQPWLRLLRCQGNQTVQTGSGVLVVFCLQFVVMKGMWAAALLAYTSYAHAMLVCTC